MQGMLTTNDKAYIRACRRVLHEDGWRIAESFSRTGCLAVRATKLRPRPDGRTDEEMLYLSHPGGPMATYHAVCNAAGVSPSLVDYDESR